jgi:predicted metal-dependent hydrolase
MSTKSKVIQVSGIKITTIRKAIKNLHLGVYPPHGRVRIAAPLKTTDESIRLFAISKIAWIKKQKKKFEKQKKQAKREFISGESHYFLGKRYLLNVVEQSKPQRVEIKKTTHIDLHVYSEEFRERKKKVLETWYREELHKASAPIIKKYEKKLGIKVNEFKIRKMKTKWGTCNADAKRVWINLELAQKPLRCLDYVIAHELVHFFEKNHNSNFVARMDKLVRNWKSIRSELNESPLGYDIWSENIS